MSKQRKRRAPLLSGVLLFPLILILTPVHKAHARAGGGEGYGYSGGSSFGGSGYGGSSQGLGGLLDLLIILNLNEPVIAIPIDILILFALYVGSSQGGLTLRNRRISSTIQTGVTKSQENSYRLKLSEIQSRYPRFFEDGFLNRAKGAFIKIQSAWAAQDMTEARALISDGVFIRFSSQLALQKSNGVKEIMENLDVSRQSILAVDSTSFFDVIHVSFTASCVNYKVYSDTGLYFDGNKSPEEFSEVWSFVRRKGAKTLERGSLEGACPNCGAIQKASRVQCEACGSFLNSGENDWVLALITQDAEWRMVKPESQVIGWDNFTSSDAAMDLISLEDRVSILFWKMRQAYHLKNADFIARFASDAYLEGFKKEIASALPEAYFNEAVGALEVLELEREPDFEWAHVSVRWMADEFSFNQQTKKYDPLGKVFRDWVFNVKRKNGVQSNPKTVLNFFGSFHCQGCGAALADGDSPTCQYCGRTLNDGGYDWVLDSVIPHSQWKPSVDSLPPEEQELYEILHSGADPQTLIKVLVAVLAADGVDHQEMKLVSQLADRAHIPMDFVLNCVDAAKSGKLQVALPQNQKEARRYLSAMAVLAITGAGKGDGEKALEAFGARFNMQKADIDLIINEERSHLYEKARKEAFA